VALNISVVIPTYNQSRFLPYAVESALAQTLPPAEIIVVDDGSTDDTPTTLRRWLNRIRVLRQPNRGVAAARNAGAAAAAGELLAFLDSDDAWLPAKLERQEARFRKDPGLGLVHCGCEEVDGEGRPLRTRIDGLAGCVRDELLLLRRPVILGGGSGLVVPRSVFDALGGFDESLSTSADWDLCYRIARRHPVGFVHEVLLQYRIHASNMHANVALTRSDMLAAFAKAFADPDVRLLRRAAYGGLHSMLAASFFQAGALGDGLRHTLQTAYFLPSRLGYFAAFPVRYLRRRLRRPESS
jgi:glycosyltransferase involved in cell wall biosynthesis